MRYETLHGLRIPKIGFGTWRIGGGDSPDPLQDELSLASLRSAFELGYTLIDTAESYAAGHGEELIGKAVRAGKIPREGLFITSKVSPEHLGYEDLLHSCENSLHRLEMDYLDLYLIHWPVRGMNLKEAFRALNKLISDGKVKHLGVSNFDIKQLNEAANLSETPLLTDQVPYSLPDRSYAENGVLEYCQENDILLTAYSPVKRRFIRGDNQLKALTERRGVTPQQIALAWLVRQPRVIAIPMSFDPQHQADNLAAADLDLSDAELALFQ